MLSEKNWDLQENWRSGEDWFGGGRGPFLEEQNRAVGGVTEAQAAASEVIHWFYNHCPFSSKLYLDLNTSFIILQARKKAVVQKTKHFSVWVKWSHHSSVLLYYIIHGGVVIVIMGCKYDLGLELQWPRTCNNSYQEVLLNGPNKPVHRIILICALPTLRAPWFRAVIFLTMSSH